jgi:hypothetical protein
MIQLLQGMFSHVAAATANCGTGGTCDTGLPGTQASAANLHAALQVVFGIISVVAVIIVIIGGLQFVIALGDSQAIAKARKTIIYALVGLGISVSAEVIVTFVLNKI